MKKLLFTFNPVAGKGLLKNELFNKGEELLQTDLVAVEREFLLRRLEELNNPRASNGR